MQRDNDCLFCKMISGAITVSKLYEDESYICIQDIHPQSKVHLLVIPKEHISSLAEVFPESLQANPALVGGLFKAAAQIAREQGLLPGGFRSVINTGGDAGQTVFHLHLHVLGGEPMKGRFGS